MNNDIQFDLPEFDIELNPPRADGAPEGIRALEVVPQEETRKLRDANPEDGCSELTLGDLAAADEQPVDDEVDIAEEIEKDLA